MRSRNSSPGAALHCTSYEELCYQGTQARGGTAQFLFFLALIKYLIDSRVFGIASNTLVQSSQSSSGLAGFESNGRGLGRGAAGQDLLCTTTAAGARQVIV